MQTAAARRTAVFAHASSPEPEASNPESRIPELQIPNPESQIPVYHLDGTGGVGVLLGNCGFHLCSLAARMAATDAPDEYICIASRATSMQTAQVIPCGSQSVTSPFAARCPTKQSSLPRWPLRSHPQ